MATILPGSVQAAPPGLRGFDCNTILTAETAERFYGDGYRFCVRYVSRQDRERSNDLTAGEATDILGAGLALMPVQHVSASGWMPGQSLGTTYGTDAAANAKSVGFPPGVNVWCDLEGVSSDATAQDVIDYCNAWYDAVHSAAYVPGLYVGANSILTGDQLYHDLEFAHYWRSESRVPTVAVRGYQMIQKYRSEPVYGIGIDEDTTQDDNLGSQVQWLIRSHA